MIDDTALLKMLVEKYPDQGPEFVISQYRAYKKGLSKVDASLTGALCEALKEQAAAGAAENDGYTEEEPSKKHYTRRSLKIKPEDAIQEDKVICCLCGMEFQSLSASHLKRIHDISVEEYKTLCGYPPEQSLMSHANLRRVRHAVENAQKARIANRAARMENDS